MFKIYQNISQWFKDYIFICLLFLGIQKLYNDIISFMKVEKYKNLTIIDASCAIFNLLFDLFVS